jgi:hypothetical protein
MIPPTLPSAPTISGKDSGPTTEASMTGHLMNRGYTQGHTMPVYLCWELHVQLCTPEHQFVSPSCHLHFLREAGLLWQPQSVGEPLLQWRWRMYSGRTTQWIFEYPTWWVIHGRSFTRLMFDRGNHFLLKHTTVVKIISCGTVKCSKQLSRRALGGSDCTPDPSCRLQGTPAATPSRNPLLQ